jgi:hypothetical protein
MLIGTMLVLCSILLILLLQTNFLIGHGLMAENDRAIRSGGYAVTSCALAHDRADRSYNNLLSNTVPSLVRCELQNISNSWAFRLYRSRFRIPGAVETERYLFFLRKRIATLSFAAPIRLGTTVCTRSHHFCLCLFAFCFTVFFSFSLHGQHLCSPSYFSHRSADQRR